MPNHSLIDLGEKEGTMPGELEVEIPDHFDIKGERRGDVILWPHWASDALIDVLKPIYRTELWPGTQRVLNALAEGYAKHMGGAQLKKSAGVNGESLSNRSSRPPYSGGS